LLKKLTLEEFKNLPFKYRTGMRSDTRAHRAYRNDEYGLQKEVITKYNKKKMEWGVGKVHYFIDGDPKEYLTVEEYYEAYVRKFEADEKRKAMRCANLSPQASESPV
jgi:hypothetical protein